MPKWIKVRLGIILAALPRPFYFIALGLLQIGWIILSMAQPSANPDFDSKWAAWVPWYAWVIAWLALMGAGFIEHSLRQKESFDKTSVNFFKAYLGFLIQEGQKIFEHSHEHDFYYRIKRWQRMAIEGIGIGLGHQASENFYHKMESQDPLEKAYREFEISKSNETLCRALKTNLDELDSMRLSLPEAETDRELKDTPPIVQKTELHLPPKLQLPPK